MAYYSIKLDGKSVEKIFKYRNIFQNISNEYIIYHYYYLILKLNKLHKLYELILFSFFS